MTVDAERYTKAREAGEVRMLRGSNFMSPIEMITRIEAARSLSGRYETAKACEARLGEFATDVIGRVTNASETPQVCLGSNDQVPYDWRLRRAADGETVELVAKRRSSVNGHNKIIEDSDHVVATWKDAQMVHPCQQTGALTHESVNMLETYLSTVAAVLDDLDGATPRAETDV